MTGLAIAERIPAPETDHVRGRLLVVEDDPHMRALIAAHLRGAGHTVAQARDGVEVLDMFVSTIWSERPDLYGVIVADIEMPGPTGLDVLAMLRHWGCETPIVLITGFGNARARAEAQQLGAFAYLEKPIDPRDLTRVIEQAMRAHGHPH